MGRIPYAQYFIDVLRPDNPTVHWRAPKDLPSTSLTSLLMLCKYSLYRAPSGKPAAIKYLFRFRIKTGPALGLLAAYYIRSMVAKFTFGSSLSPMLCSTCFFKLSQTSLLITIGNHNLVGQIIRKLHDLAKS